MKKIKRYGWTRDSLDHRDQRLMLPPRAVLPTSADLRQTGFLPPVYDQGQLGSCTANAIAGAVDFERKKQGEAWMTPSRLFIYYNERVIEGDTDQDNGAEIRDGIKSIAAQGVCPEAIWPYSDQGDQFAVQPTPAAYAAALKAKTLQYSTVAQNDYAVKYALAILGRPVVFGFSVFDSFESSQVQTTGIVPLPGSDDAPIGGHAVCCVGFVDSVQQFICRNSWGAAWGQAGYFRLPYAYMLNAGLANDFWVITAES